MTQRAENVIDLAAYRTRRVQHSLLPEMIPSDLLQNRLMFAVPVLMPIVVAWLPVWSMAVLSTSAPDE